MKKALSIRQIWAILVAAGLKDVENRSRRISYRGPILIHAASTANSPQRYITSAYNEACRIDPAAFQVLGPLRWWLPTYGKGGRCVAHPRRQHLYGAIIGQATLVDCVQNHPSRWAEPGAWHWVFAEARLFEKAIPAKGRLGLFDVSELQGLAA